MVAQSIERVRERQRAAVARRRAQERIRETVPRESRRDWLCPACRLTDLTAGEAAQHAIEHDNARRAEEAVRHAERAH